MQQMTQAYDMKRRSWVALLKARIFLFVDLRGKNSDLGSGDEKNKIKKLCHFQSFFFFFNISRKKQQ